MIRDFAISPEWLSATNGLPEVAHTSAFLSIAFGDLVATRNEDAWSKTVRSNVRLSAYPLAMWLVASWWRLRWEPSNERNRRNNQSWRMAHELPAAGHGYIWPRVTFECDGELVEISCTASSPLTREPIKYLESFRTSIAAHNFELAADDFVNTVLARLSAVDAQNTDLQLLWDELRKERLDATAASYRMLEARLGFDPDDAPEGLVEDFELLIPRAGPDAVSEIAPACAGSNAKQAFENVVQLVDTAGITATVGLDAAKLRRDPALTGRIEPWERGRMLAHAVRSELALDGAALTDEDFSGILNVPVATFQYHAEPPKPLSLGVRKAKPNEVELIFRRRSRVARRFEAARLVADHLVTPRREHWLPATDAKTSRQKMQRAFAAEFLCPISALTDFMEDDYSSEDAINEAGEHFGISALAVRSHLANHGLIDRADVSTDAA